MGMEELEQPDHRRGHWPHFRARQETEGQDGALNGEIQKYAASPRSSKKLDCFRSSLERSSGTIPGSRGP